MIENFKHSSPSMSDCRRTACSSPGSLTEVIVNKAQFVRRRRMELRQRKSPCQIRSEIADEDCRSLFKKVIHEIDSNVEEFEGDKSSGNDAVVAGTSKAKNDEVMENSRSRACLSHGSMSVIGRRREMEDAVTVERSFLTGDSGEYDFFGVYDGHGGSRVAHACRDWLHRLLVKAVEEDGGGKVDWTKVMRASFQKMDEEMSRRGAAVATVGSTAVVAIVGEEELVVANCGDSRVVLSRAGQAVALSSDHKPDRPNELGRIEACGGRVLNWNGQRVLGVLATSRSIGDQYLKPFVISEPEVTVNKRTDADEFLILATDGLWDVISNDVACRVTRRCLNGQTKRKSQGTLDERTGEFNRASAAATVLAELAMARGSKDNISVMVVELTKSMSNM